MHKPHKRDPSLETPFSNILHYPCETLNVLFVRNGSGYGETESSCFSRLIVSSFLDPFSLSAILLEVRNVALSVHKYRNICKKSHDNNIK